MTASLSTICSDISESKEMTDNIYLALSPPFFPAWISQSLLKNLMSNRIIYKRSQHQKFHTFISIMMSGRWKSLAIENASQVLGMDAYEARAVRHVVDIGDEDIIIRHEVPNAKICMILGVAFKVWAKHVFRVEEIPFFIIVAVFRSGVRLKDVFCNVVAFDNEDLGYIVQDQAIWMSNIISMSNYRAAESCLLFYVKGMEQFKINLAKEKGYTVKSLLEMNIQTKDSVQPAMQVISKGRKFIENIASVLKIRVITVDALDKVPNADKIPRHHMYLVGKKFIFSLDLLFEYIEKYIRNKKNDPQYVEPHPTCLIEYSSVSIDLDNLFIKLISGTPFVFDICSIESIVHMRRLYDVLSYITYEMLIEVDVSGNMDFDMEQAEEPSFDTISRRIMDVDGFMQKRSYADNQSFISTPYTDECNRIISFSIPTNVLQKEEFVRKKNTRSCEQKRKIGDCMNDEEDVEKNFIMKKRKRHREVRWMKKLRAESALTEEEVFACIQIKKGGNVKEVFEKLKEQRKDMFEPPQEKDHDRVHRGDGFSDGYSDIVDDDGEDDLFQILGVEKFLKERKKESSDIDDLENNATHTDTESSESIHPIFPDGSDWNDGCWDAEVLRNRRNDNIFGSAKTASVGALKMMEKLPKRVGFLAGMDVRICIHNENSAYFSSNVHPFSLSITLMCILSAAKRALWNAGIVKKSCDACGTNLNNPMDRVCIAGLYMKLRRLLWNFSLEKQNYQPHLKCPICAMLFALAGTCAVLTTSANVQLYNYDYIIYTDSTLEDRIRRRINKFTICPYLPLGSMFVDAIRSFRNITYMLSLQTRQQHFRSRDVHVDDVSILKGKAALHIACRYNAEWMMEKTKNPARYKALRVICARATRIFDLHTTVLMLNMMPEFDSLRKRCYVETFMAPSDEHEQFCYCIIDALMLEHVQTCLIPLIFTYATQQQQSVVPCPLHPLMMRNYYKGTDEQLYYFTIWLRRMMYTNLTHEYGEKAIFQQNSFDILPLEEVSFYRNLHPIIASFPKSVLLHELTTPFTTISTFVNECRGKTHIRKLIQKIESDKGKTIDKDTERVLNVLKRVLLKWDNKKTDGQNVETQNTETVDDDDDNNGIDESTEPNRRECLDRYKQGVNGFLISCERSFYSSMMAFLQPDVPAKIAKSSLHMILNAFEMNKDLIKDHPHLVILILELITPDFTTDIQKLCAAWALWQIRNKSLHKIWRQIKVFYRFRVDVLEKKLSYGPDIEIIPFNCRWFAWKLYMSKCVLDRLITHGGVKKGFDAFWHKDWRLSFYNEMNVDPVFSEKGIQKKRKRRKKDLAGNFIPVKDEDEEDKEYELIFDDLKDMTEVLDDNLYYEQPKLKKGDIWCSCEKCACLCPENEEYELPVNWIFYGFKERKFHFFNRSKPSIGLNNEAEYRLPMRSSIYPGHTLPLRAYIYNFLGDPRTSDYLKRTVFLSMYATSRKNSWRIKPSRNWSTIQVHDAMNSKCAVQRAVDLHIREGNLQGVHRPVVKGMTPDIEKEMEKMMSEEWQKKELLHCEAMCKEGCEKIADDLDYSSDEDEIDGQFVYRPPSKNKPITNAGMHPSQVYTARLRRRSRRWGAQIDITRLNLEAYEPYVRLCVNEKEFRNCGIYDLKELRKPMTYEEIMDDEISSASALSFFLTNIEAMSYMSHSCPEYHENGRILLKTRKWKRVPNFREKCRGYYSREMAEDTHMIVNSVEIAASDLPIPILFGNRHKNVEFSTPSRPSQAYCYASTILFPMYMPILYDTDLGSTAKAMLCPNLSMARPFACSSKTALVLAATSPIEYVDETARDYMIRFASHSKHGYMYGKKKEKTPKTKEDYMKEFYDAKFRGVRARRKKRKRRKIS